MLIDEFSRRVISSLKKLRENNTVTYNFEIWLLEDSSKEQQVFSAGKKITA